VPALLPKSEVLAVDDHNAVGQAMTKNIRGRSVGLWPFKLKRIFHLFYFSSHEDNSSTNDFSVSVGTSLNILSWMLLNFFPNPSPDK
jgi:hypothetical protein